MNAYNMRHGANDEFSFFVYFVVDVVGWIGQYNIQRSEKDQRNAAGWKASDSKVRTKIETAKTSS